MADVIDFPKKLNDQVTIKTWMLNNEISITLSRHEEEIQFLAVVGVLLEMFNKNPTLKPALLAVLERRSND